MKEPISKPSNIRFRGPTSSSEYNQSEKDKYTDLVELFKENNDNFIRFMQGYEMCIIENNALNSKVNELLLRQDALTEKINNLSNSVVPIMSEQKKFAKDMTIVFPNDFQHTEEAPVHIEADYNLARINSINSVPKTYFIDSLGTREPAKDIVFEVKRANEGKGTVIQNDYMNMFDGKKESAWRYNAQYVNQTDIREKGEEIDITITLPKSMPGINKVNCISMNLHPYSGVEVHNLEVFYNNQWTKIYDDAAIRNNANSKRKWIFEEMFAERIRFTLIQKSGIIQGGISNFILGIQNLEVSYEVFTKSKNYVLIPFEMNGLYDIEKVEVEFLNRKAISYSEFFDKDLLNTIYSYELLYEDLSGVLHPLTTKEWIAQSYNKIWLKVLLSVDHHNGVAPCLYSAKLIYKQY